MDSKHIITSLRNDSRQDVECAKPPKQSTVWIKTNVTITFQILQLQPFGRFQNCQCGAILAMQHVPHTSNAAAQPVVGV